MPTDMKQSEFYSRDGEFPVKGSSRKATSGMGNTTAKGAFTPDIDFAELYGASTPEVDRQFIHAIVTDAAGLPTAAPKNGKSKKGY